MLMADTKEGISIGDMRETLTGFVNPGDDMANVKIYAGRSR